MARAIATMLGVMIGSHGLVGLFIEGKHLLGVLNVDIFIDLVYLALAAGLLVTALTPLSKKTIRGMLALTGIVFLVIGVAASIDDKLGGLMPRGSTLVDLALFYGAGLGALWASLPALARPLVTQDKEVY